MTEEPSNLFSRGINPEDLISRIIPDWASEFHEDLEHIDDVLQAILWYVQCHPIEDFEEGLCNMEALLRRWTLSQVFDIFCVEMAQNSYLSLTEAMAKTLITLEQYYPEKGRDC